MAAKATIQIALRVDDLGEPLRDTHFGEPISVPTGQISPTVATLGTTDVEEKVNLDVLDTVRGLMIKSLDDDLLVDLDYDGSTFHPCLELIGGEEATYIPNPKGDVYVKNSTTAETPVYEYSAWGIASV